MGRTRTHYTKRALTLDEQLDKLSDRNIILHDVIAAKKILANIGYYRLGFYIFPFEKTYPILGKKRQKEVVAGTTFESVVALYSFDFDLRNILNKYLSLIEITLRTTMVSEMSIKYKSNPTWFMNKDVVTDKFIAGFQQTYNNMRTKPIMQRHHNKYLGAYAPAWKTMEYITLGNLEASKIESALGCKLISIAK